METISEIKKELSGIKNILNDLDTSIYMYADPDCILGSKQYYDSDYYRNIKPDDAFNYIQRLQRIYERIKLINDKLGLKYLLSEVTQIKDLAIKSDEVYHYHYFFDLYSLACKVENDIKKQIETPNLQQVDPILSKDQFNALKADFINNMDYNTLIHVLKYKKLPAGEVKGEWKSKAVEAYRFANRFNIKCSEFNKCFYFPKAGKQLRCNDKPGADQPDTGAIDNVFDTKKATR